jgi:hypothetical protein
VSLDSGLLQLIMAHTTGQLGVHTYVKPTASLFLQFLLEKGKVKTKQTPDM